MATSAEQTPAPARIGPNAILQMLPVIEAEGGKKLVQAMLDAAGISEIPADTGLMPEAPAAALHQAVRAHLPDRAARIATEAGTRTADYIIQHRIPSLVVWLLPKLPHRLAARILTNSIQHHAWTFTGSGRFNVLTKRPIRLQIADNPVVRGEEAEEPICHWHAAVFTRLYQRLVRADYQATEQECCANHHPACRFEIKPAA